MFGEGVNPRLRKVRDGLSELGLPADELLNHGVPRLVYGMSLVRNLREYLLGIDDEPELLVSERGAERTTSEIVTWWLSRLPGRIVREDVLERMAEHRVVHPICHGARVRLPADDSGQRMLFDD